MKQRKTEMGNCPVCDNALAEIHGEIKCPYCGYLRNREEQDMQDMLTSFDKSKNKTQ